MMIATFVFNMRTWQCKLELIYIELAGVLNKYSDCMFVRVLSAENASKLISGVIEVAGLV